MLEAGLGLTASRRGAASMAAYGAGHSGARAAFVRPLAFSEAAVRCEPGPFQGSREPSARGPVVRGEHAGSTEPFECFRLPAQS